MSTDRPTPLDRMRHYVHTQQQADRPSESYLTVTLGDLAALVTEIDVLRALGKAAPPEEELPTTEEVLGMMQAQAVFPEKLDEKGGRLYDRIRAVLAENDGFDPSKLSHDNYRQQTLRLLALLSSEQEDEENALREDLEDAQNQRQDLEDKLKKSKELVLSLKINGARHNFEFAYDKPSINGSPYTQHCKVCDREKGHPAHFFSGAVYLDSRDIDRIVQAVRERLTDYLKSQPLLDSRTPQKVALDLLGGLPGIPLAEEAPQEDAEPHCACGAPRGNHPFKHPFTSAPPEDRPGSAR